MNKSIVIFQFSPRKSGNCGTIGAFLQQFHREDSVTLYHLDGGIFGPCGGCDYECLQPGLRCPVLTPEESELMDRACEAELVYFILPNFCGRPCANYFAFNERTVGYFGLDRSRMQKYMAVPKKFIVVSNTEGFEEALCQQAKEPRVLYLKSGRYGKRSIAGDLLESGEAVNDLLEFLNSGA